MSLPENGTHPKNVRQADEQGTKQRRTFPYPTDLLLIAMSNDYPAWRKPSYAIAEA